MPDVWVEREFTGEWSVTLSGRRAEDGEAVRAVLIPVVAELVKAGAPIRGGWDVGTRITNDDGGD